MMCWMNFWTTLYYSIYLFGFTGAGMGMIRFCSLHPDAAWDVILFCLCGAFGQVRVPVRHCVGGALLGSAVRELGCI